MVMYLDTLVFLTAHTNYPNEPSSNDSFTALLKARAIYTFDNNSKQILI